MGRFGLESFVGALLGFAAGVVGADFVLHDSVALISYVESLSKWQALTGGFLAVSGAVLTVSAILKQVGEQKRQFDDVRFRNARSSRAVAGIELARICQYAKEATRLARLFPRTRGAVNQAQVEEIEDRSPELPESSILLLSRAAEYSDDEAASDLTKLFGCLQVQNSRMISAMNEVVEGGIATSSTRGLSETADRLLFDAANVHADASALFAWARWEEEGNLLDEDPRWRISNSLGNLGIREKDYPGVWAILEERYPRDTKA